MAKRCLHRCKSKVRIFFVCKHRCCKVGKEFQIEELFSPIYLIIEIEDILGTIFQHLPYHELLTSICLVCKFWSHYVSINKNQELYLTQNMHRDERLRLQVKKNI